MSLQTTMRNAVQRRAETENEDAEDREREDARAEDENEETASRVETEDDDQAEADDETEARAETDDEDAEDEDETESRRGASPTPARRRGRGGRKAYGLAEAAQTVELCAIAGVSARRAHRFVKAKTPLADVRRSLAGAAGGSSPERLDTAPAKASPTAGWDDVIGKVNAAARVQGR